jgi:hypothetical protein
MRWAIIALLTASLLVSAQSRCGVFELYRIAHTFHDPAERHAKMLEWLQKYGGFCSKDELTFIWNNLAGWAGTADSAQLRQRVIDLYNNQL